MGSFRGSGNRKKRKGGGPRGVWNGRGETYFGNPKLKKGHKHGATGGDNAKKSPVAVHFFFWLVVFCVFATVFGFFQAQIQSIVLWNDVFTLFGAISYANAYVGWMISIIFIWCVDMVMVA